MNAFVMESGVGATPSSVAAGLGGSPIQVPPPENENLQRAL